MKVNFSFIYFLTQNFVIFFFFSFEKFVVKIKFLSQFSVLANFYRKNIKKIRFVCEQEHGKEKSHYISNTFSLALSFPLYYIEGF